MASPEDTDGSKTERESELIDDFVSQYFPDGYPDEHSSLTAYGPSDSEGVGNGEGEVVDKLLAAAASHFDSSKGTLGLAIDFVVLAEKLSQVDGWPTGFDPSRTKADLLDRYESAAESTLTVKRNGVREGIRPTHNKVIDLFREDLHRTNFPSSPGHHTGEWERYDDMLDLALQLSRAGRYEALYRLIDLGLEKLEKKDYQRREPPYPDPFIRVLKEYDRSASFEQGGSAYQAFCYGYVKAQWPHLSLRASKVRTGSARQNRYGDIDGFHGPDLMISVEVKDLAIDSANVASQLGTMTKVAENTTAIAIAICGSVSDEARETLEDNGVEVIDDEDLEKRLATWDYHKQNRALQGMIHFLTNIEENPDATQRLLKFIEVVDPENEALAHLN